MDEKKIISRREAIKVGFAGLAATFVGAGLLTGCGSDGRGRKPRVIAINGSPRKDMNTATLIDQALKGAREAGAEVERVDLYDIKFKGCVSCLNCKLKKARTYGLCAYRDDLRPILQRCREADVIIFGSPIYYGNVNGTMRSFLERLMFPLDSYAIDKQTGERARYLDGTVPVGFIYTMNCPEQMRERAMGPMFRSIEGYVSRIFGSCETLYSTNTYQYKDYSLYDVNMMREEDKRAWRDAQFPKDKRLAFDMGSRLVGQIVIQG